MKRGLVLLISAAIGAGAQTPPASPAAGRGSSRGFGRGAPVLQSPEVSADRRPMFRLPAPKAKEVQVRAITQQPIPRRFKTCLDSKGVKATCTEIPDKGHVRPLWPEPGRLHPAPIQVNPRRGTK